MQIEEQIVVSEFCIHHHIEPGFISALQQSGLIEITQVEEKWFVHENQLPELEKMVRLYYEMDINLEGIETITYLLSRMNQMQQDIMQLKNRLGMYEKD